MNSMRRYHNYRPSPLEIKQLAEFDATLGDLPEAEKKQRRIFYLRNAIQQFDIGKSILKGFGCLMIPFILIPIFWPFLLFFWFMKKKATHMLDYQANNALEYWNIQQHEVFPNKF